MNATRTVCRACGSASGVLISAGLVHRPNDRICPPPVLLQEMLRDAIDPINENTEVLDIFNCLVRSDAIRRLNDALGLQPRAAGFFS